MTKDDIIRMAREAGCIESAIPDWVIRTCALVASAEREACIEDIQWHIPRAGRHTPEYQMAMRMIERIRARGQT